MNKKKYTSTLILLSAAIIWGFAFAAQDAASDMGAFTLGFARSIIAGIFLLGVVIASDKVTGSERRLISRRGIDLNKSELIGGMIIGAVLVIASAFQQIGINSGTDGGKAAFITALYPRAKEKSGYKRMDKHCDSGCRLLPLMHHRGAHGSAL